MNEDLKALVLTLARLKLAELNDRITAHTTKDWFRDDLLEDRQDLIDALRPFQPLMGAAINEANK